LGQIPLARLRQPGVRLLDAAQVVHLLCNVFQVCLERLRGSGYGV
jgi:hypothetical protein